MFGPAVANRRASRKLAQGVVDDSVRPARNKMIPGARVRSIGIAWAERRRSRVRSRWAEGEQRNGSNDFGDLFHLQLPFVGSRRMKRL